MELPRCVPLRGAAVTMGGNFRRSLHTYHLHKRRWKGLATHRYCSVIHLINSLSNLIRLWRAMPLQCSNLAGTQKKSTCIHPPSPDQELCTLENTETQSRSHHSLNSKATPQLQIPRRKAHMSLDRTTRNQPLLRLCAPKNR